MLCGRKGTFLFFFLQNRLKYFFRRDKSIVKIINRNLYDLPSPKNISYWWKFGSLLGLVLVIQIVTGLFLAMHYVSDMKAAFLSVDSIRREVFFGGFIRAIHAKGASAFFFFIYLHMGRGVYYGSFYHKPHTWGCGVMIYILAMGAGFLGYVLPWGQMSYWGATVITNFASTVPFVGGDLVQWIWGGFAVSYPTLTRFFTLHYLVPFIVVILVAVHLIYLHDTGSKNPLGINTKGDRVPFHPYFTIKDILGFVIFFLFFIPIIFLFPDRLGDPEKYIEANPLVTPIHIQPEWYFLPSYAILRAIPKKLGGVIALIMSFSSFFLLPLLVSKAPIRFFRSSIYQTIFWLWSANIFLLTWVGSCPVEYPYIKIGILGRVVYFLFFFILPFLSKIKKSS